jgi:siderophore synthetase component
VTPGAAGAELLGCQALLNCLVREVSGPEEQVLADPMVTGDGGFLVIRLPRSAGRLRARIRRPSAGIGPRLDGYCEVLDPHGRWRTAGGSELAALIAAELTLASGIANEEFATQVGNSNAALAAILGSRADGGSAGGGSAGGGFLASEQALLAGHRFHPAPKARPGAPSDWLRYAPETGARFPLRFLGVRSDVLAEVGDTGALDRLGGPVPPPGYRLLPAHPWQFGLVSDEPWFRRAFSGGLITDLGSGSRPVAPTSSVRTVYDPVADVFCKFSLNVRLTNCVRKSAWYELAGSVLLTELLSDVFGAFPEAVLLGEPGYRTAALAIRDAYEGLAVIVREGVAARLPPGVTPLLAASLTEPAFSTGPASTGPALFDGRDGDWLAGWWQAYVRLVAAPVLGAYFEHGVVFEPHLQNVLVGVDHDGWPVRVIFRDLEGVKLVTGRHAALLASLPPGIAGGLGYDAARGWDRVAYCLFVNNLAEIAAAIVDRMGADRMGAEFERALWRAARDELTIIAKEHGWPPQLRAVLAGVPLPAKANLRVRWARAADREAGYIPVPNPLGGLS